MQTTVLPTLQESLNHKGVLLVPNKYLEVVQDYIETPTTKKVIYFYRLRYKHLKRCTRFSETEQQTILYLGILFPSGRTVLKQVTSRKMDGNISFLLKNQQMEPLEFFYINKITLKKETT